MRLGYHSHARERMTERGITEGDVLNALENFTERLPTPKNSMRYTGPGLNGRRLKVWVKLPDTNPSDDKVVKSVAWRDE